MRIYIGARCGGRVYVYAGESEGPLGLQPLESRTDLRNHSPDGPNWGYCGSGPAQLALALIADATGDDALALACYQGFRERVVARLSAEGWALTADDVRESLHDLIGSDALVRDRVRASTLRSREYLGEDGER